MMNTGGPSQRYRPAGELMLHARGSHSRFGIAYARLIAFLAAFAALVIFVAHYYLFPAMEAAKNATPPQRRVLAAHSRLVLAILLFILLCGLILTFRVGRFFLPRRGQRNKPTIYPDAWAESARRLEVDRDEP